MRHYSQNLPLQRQGLALAMALASCTLLSGGCASHGHGAAKHAGSQKPACYPCGPCAGYFPTCWKMWPDVCPSCPIYGGDELAVMDPSLQAQPAEGVPLPPTGAEIISPGRDFDAGSMRLSPAEGDDAAPKPPLPDDPPRPEDQGRFKYRGPFQPRRGLDDSSARNATSSRDERVSPAPWWQRPSLPNGSTEAAKAREFAAESQFALVSDAAHSDGRDVPVIKKAVR